MIEIPTILFSFLLVFAAFGGVSVFIFILCGPFAINIKKPKKEKSKGPTHWCLGWNGNVELGFDDGTYLSRDIALILYPEYFDNNGNPNFEMLPFDEK